MLLIALFIIFFAYKIYYDHKASIALEKSAIVIGAVDYIEHTRGITNVYVHYLYDGKKINSVFGTYNQDVLDSLKNKPNVRMRIAKAYPAKYIEYIGVYTE